jgi:hypothetical protein
MADPIKPTPTAEPIPTPATPEVFDIDKAMNTKGFIEFLAKYPDAKDFDMEDAKEVGKRFEVFGKKEEVKKGLKEAFAKEIQEKMGIKLSNEDLASMDAEIERRAIENPEEINRQKEHLALFAELPGKIAALDADMVRLSGGRTTEQMSTELEGHRTIGGALDVSKSYFGKIGKTTMYARVIGGFVSSKIAHRGETGKIQDAMDTVNNRYATDGKPLDQKEVTALVKTTNENISEIMQKLGEIRKKGADKSFAERDFAAAEANILGTMNDFKALTEIIQKKAADSLNDMLTKGTVPSLDKAQEKLALLKSVQENTKTGVNPLAGFNDLMFQDMLDAAVQEKVKDHMTEAVLNAKLGNNALKNLENALEAFTGKERVGSLEGDEAQAFIVDTLEEIRDELGDNEEAQTKKLMLARILVKIKK